MSTTSDRRIVCRILSRAMKVPERPTPAEQWTTTGRCSGVTRSRKARTKRTRVCGGSGTPKSGQVQVWSLYSVLFCLVFSAIKDHREKMFFIMFFFLPSIEADNCNRRNKCRNIIKIKNTVKIWVGGLSRSSATVSLYLCSFWSNIRGNVEASLKGRCGSKIP